MLNDGDVRRTGTRAREINSQRNFNVTLKLKVKLNAN